MLQVKQLSCERQRRELFYELSFSCNAGEAWHVRGANGAGKTTLLRVLAGLFSNYEGEVVWDVDRFPLYIGHRPGVKNQLTCLENLAWLMRLHQDDTSEESLRDALGEIGLGGYENVLCGQLSEGQRKRVSLARMLLSDSPVWILDEPFSASR